MASITIQPICGRLLLQVVPPPRTAGSIHLPDQLRRDKHREAWVKALPPRYKGRLEVGDRVMVPPYPEREIVINGETLVFVKEKDLEMALEV